MTKLVGGDRTRPDAEALFRRGLARYDVSAVCLRDGERAPALRIILQGAGFRRHSTGTRIEIWVREDAAHGEAQH